ncbi:HpcH/HpaI aldolase/citrate lyase family protein [Sphingomonas abietis]|uniref:CoA ester lyase n=1 Tax=Sphingomonas abietis TaxID=3012344 RepID=A0ABY7NP89_9SPHN|nr:CoA ester lyase [Sphingomonas abietis]WBO21291.1 CoA ester lyase [Sphingomonas abietis]
MSLPARSILFVPGDRPERFDKAAASGADMVVIDLEDAVLIDRKAAARTLVHEALAALDAPRFVVRVNSVGTDWHGEDVRALAGLPGLAGLMLPKAEAAEDFAAMQGAGVPLHALVETVRGVLGLSALCATERLVRLSFGTVDFQVEAGIDGDGEELDAVRTMMVLHSKAAGLEAPVDGVSVDLSDDEALARDACRSRRFGFGGKLCVHPRQVAVVNAAFAPSRADVEWAERVMVALSGGHGAVAVDGKLIDKPIVDRARLVLAAHESYGIAA